MEEELGARFEIDHANFVGYLTAGPGAVAPRADATTLCRFLTALAHDENVLIGSTEGKWISKIRNVAEQQAYFVSQADDVLNSRKVSERLDPLRQFFTGYALYAMVLPSSQVDADSHSFFYEASESSPNALFFMPQPDLYNDLTQRGRSIPSAASFSRMPDLTPRCDVLDSIKKLMRSSLK